MKMIWIIGGVVSAFGMLLAWSVKPKLNDHIVSMGYGMPSISPPTEDEIKSLPARLRVYHVYACLTIFFVTIGALIGQAIAGDIGVVIPMVLGMACIYRAIWLAVMEQSGW